MIAFLRTLALLVSVYGGQLQCPPVDPPSCTLFVSVTLAIDVFADPWGNVGIERWNPAEWKIGEEN